MSNLADILRDSFEMLLDRPQLFAPRIFSSSLSSLVIVGWAVGQLGTLQFLALFPFITVIGSFTPVIVSSMVKNREDEKPLKTGFKDSLHLWKPVLGFTVVTILLGFVNSIPLAAGLTATYMTGEIMFLVAGLFISLLMLLTIAFSFYFVPITLLETGNLFGSIKDSVNTSRNNRREVTLLMVFSLIVLTASSLTTGQLRNFGLAIFFLGRMISSIVGTYLIVISPHYYLKQGGDNED